MVKTDDYGEVLKILLFILIVQHFSKFSMNAFLFYLHLGELRKRTPVTLETDLKRAVKLPSEDVAI